MGDFRALTLYVVRHGECEHNVEGRLASRDDSPLTETGRAQARANGHLLRELASDLGTFDFYASSLHRTCATMELLRAAAGLPSTGYRADHRLMEMHCGDQIWMRWKDIPPEDHALYQADPWHLARPGGVGVSVGDEVVLLGAQRGSAGADIVRAEEIAARVGTIPYEVLCAVSRRVPRGYTGGAS